MQRGSGSMCYANGVEVASVLLAGFNHEVLTYTKNGKECFIEDYQGMGGTGTMSITSAVTTYTGPDGTTLATENDVSTATGTTSTVTCGGTTFVLDTMSAACSSADGGAACTTGICN